MNLYKTTILKKVLIALAIVIVSWLLTGSERAEAQVTPLINFIGKITNIDGSEIADDTYDITFSLYTGATGGASIWSEVLASTTRFSGAISNVGASSDGIVYTYSGASATSTFQIGQYITNSLTSESVLIVAYDTALNTVTVASNSPTWVIGQPINNRPVIEGGIINEYLGTVSDISAVNFGQTIYLEIAFNGETMQPRKLFTTVPHAFESATLEGRSESEFAALADDETITGEWDFNNIVNIATSSSVSALTVTQNGSGNIVEFKLGATTAFAVLSDGRVQIGDYYFPTTHGAAGYVLKTDLAGNLYWDPDIAGTGGGTGLWASSTDNLFIFQAITGQTVVLGNNATSSLGDFHFEVYGDSLMDMISIRDQEEIRFYDTGSTNYMAIRASTSLSSNFILTLPDSVGTIGQALLTDGNGNLSWGAPSGGTVYVTAGTQGQIGFYNTTGSQISGTSTIFLSQAGYFGIGTSSLDELLTVGGISGSQFMVNTDGEIISGTWHGDIVSVAYGGIGTSTFEANSVLFASADDTIGEILAGANGYVLKMFGGVPVWQPDLTVGGESSLWATSSDDLRIYPTDISKVIVFGAQATSSLNTIFEVTGNSFFSGSISAQDLSLVTALSAGYGGTGSSTPSGIMLGDGAGNIVSLANNSSNWDQAFVWGDHSTQNYFDQDTDVLAVALGGTGTSTFEANSLLYASANDIIGEVLAGAEGEALVIQGGVPTWSTTTPGTAHGILSTQHSDVEATSTIYQGDLLHVNAGGDWARIGLGVNGYILRSNGTDLEWSSTINITALGTVTVGTWQGDVIGLAYGGTGSTTAAGARENLGLEDIYKFGITSTGTTGYVWQSDGDGKGEWVATSSLGIASGSGSTGKFIGTSTYTSVGLIATGSLIGYIAANDICSFEYANGFFCRTYDMLVTIEQDDVSDWVGGGNAWMAEGPPGYTYESNDCMGWTSSSSVHLGAFWEFDDDGGGMGWLVNCAQEKPLTCCTWQ